jgi:hypothetical protein
MPWVNESGAASRRARRCCPMKWTHAALVFIAACLLPAPALASDFRLTETFSMSWHGDNRDQDTTNDDYFDFKDRLNLMFIQEMVETSMRLDSMTIFNYDLDDPAAPAGKQYRDDYRIERLTGILKPRKDLKLTFGDFYAQLGSGILLSLRKIDEFGSETVLRGGKVDFDSKYISFSAMGGVTNINNVDELNNYFFEDPMDRIVAGRVSATPVERLKIEALGLLLGWKDVKAGEVLSPKLFGTGLLLESAVLPGRLTLGAEADMLWREKAVPGGTDHDMGEAAYLKLNGIAGPVSVLLEWKWYEKFDISGSTVGGLAMVYNQPPTAERVDQEPASITTVYGGRVKTDVKLSDTFFIHANFSGGDYAPLTDVIRGEEVKRVAYYLHAYGGFTMFMNEGMSEISVSGGWRREMEPDLMDPEGGWTRHAHVYHVESKFLFYIARGWSLRYSILHESRGKIEGIGYGEYERGTQIAGVDLSGVMSLSAAFEYDTQYHRMPFDENLFGWWEAKFYPARGLVLVFKGGLERGGLTCVSGVCRTIPPFAGVRVDLVYRY